MLKTFTNSKGQRYNYYNLLKQTPHMCLSPLFHYYEHPYSSQQYNILVMCDYTCRVNFHHGIARSKRVLLQFSKLTPCVWVLTAYQKCHYHFCSHPIQPLMKLVWLGHMGIIYKTDSNPCRGYDSSLTITVRKTRDTVSFEIRQEVGRAWERTQELGLQWWGL